MAQGGLLCTQQDLLLLMVFFLLPIPERSDSIFACQQEGSKSGEGVLLHLPSPHSCAARWGKWNPSFILDDPTHNHESARLLLYVAMFLSIGLPPLSSKVRGREPAVRSYRHRRKTPNFFTTVKLVIISYDVLSCHIIFQNIVNHIDGHDIKLSLS